MKKPLHPIQAIFTATLLLFIFTGNLAQAQTTTVGSGSYTNTFPGVDEAGRNGFPPGTPQVSGAAAGRPIPTNDWWSALLQNDHVSNLFSYPMALKTTNQGLVVSYIPWGVYDDQEPIVVGVTDLNATRATVSDYSDWTVTLDFNDGSHQIEAKSGVAMPFIYFEKSTGDEARVIINLGEVTVEGEMITVANARNGADFAIYAPAGSSWTQNGKTYTSDLNGNDYWSMAMLPQGNNDIAQVAEEYKAYAYVFPTNTTANWDYNESTGAVRTEFNIETEVKEGTGTDMLIGLLPHQWGNLAGDSPNPDGYSYESVRGEIKTMAGNTFTVENTFRGILPTMPYLANYSEGFSPAELESKIAAIENEGLATWTDSYNEGQVMNRLIQTARIANQTGNTEARDKIIATIKERLEDWLTYEAGEVAFLFYYNSDWTAMLGYPAGHGQDNNINDHHFHWGYFIHAAAFMEQYEPGWSAKWGDMINHLVRDASSPNRNDELFPYLRNFSPYSGHCWANGFASFPQGNDQESTSESMQFHTSLIHWGTITGNDEIRDLGIYLYTTEQTAIEEYWFDMNDRVFQDGQQYGMVSRVWGNSYDNQTFWTADITASYVIEMYPIHGGSFYLGQNTDYVSKIWEELKTYTGILNPDDENPNLWHDVIWKYLSFIDPEEAIDLYNDNPDRILKFGVSDAQTYHWLHSINAMGRVKADITADYPIAVAFEQDGEITYVAHNYSDTPITVTYSDGFTLQVPANEMATNRDVEATGLLTTNFDRAAANGSVTLSAEVSGNGITRVEFIDGNTVIGEATEAPFNMKAENLSLGIHGFYARVYIGDQFNVTNIVTVQVGEQIPYEGSPYELPGTIEAGHYDKYEGGLGQGVSYVDVDANNNGDYRTDEGVDVASSTAEGATIGWIAGGEWVEYTIEVKEAGLYDMDFRYASANGNGGGPFHLQLDGTAITDDITVPTTGGWDTWATKTVTDIPFSQGSHILRVAFGGGEFNLAKMTFTREGPLPYSQPVAVAGGNLFVELPDTEANLDGSASSDPDGGNLTFQWSQEFGPSEVVFEDATSAATKVSGLELGVYLIKLTVSNGNYSDEDELYITVDDDGIINPVVAITSPEDGQSFIAGQTINITATATDQDGTIAQVEFFVDETSVGTSSAAPYMATWSGEVGSYSITAVATDDGGNTTTSEEVDITLTEAPPCRAEAPNGEFSYEFSDDSENPTLTFIPGSEGVGEPTCILYYSTDPNVEFPGQNVTPNQPFTLEAAAGSTVYFYYTYSYPGDGNHTTIDNILSYVVGTCTPVEDPVTISMENAIMDVDENSPVGTVVGTPTVNYDGEAPLTFSILSSTAPGAFTMDEATGEITVAITSMLDFETTPDFLLSVNVTDGTVSDNASITINLNDVDEGVVTGLEDALAAGLVWYPNPVTTELFLEMPIGADIAVRHIYDAQGREQVIPMRKEEEVMIFNFSSANSGMYIILMERKEKRYYLKVLKR